MKTKRVVISVATILALIPILAKLLLVKAPPPEGSILTSEIVSYCIGDAIGDGTNQLLAIAGEGEIDSGERHGEYLLVCEASAKDDMDSLGYIPPEKIYYNIDITGIKPLKVQMGDINGDGVKEIAICVYKTAKYHPVMVKRPFFFSLVEGNLIPVWLGSRLSRPFDDYILYDIDADDIDEIISIELLENDDRVITAYDWRGFGFEVLAQSDEFEGKLLFDSDMTFQLDEGNLIYK